MAYATYADLEHALDATIIAQLCGDAGVPMPGPNSATDAALERGTATLRAYVRVGDIYTDAEIAALVAAHDPLLVAIVVDLATEFLFQRRGAKISPAIEQRIKQSYSYLEALRDGKMLFGAVGIDGPQAAAGTPLVAAVSASNLAWYASAANSQFFPPRRGTTYP
jgi:phage gp36-like protein